MCEKCEKELNNKNSEKLEEENWLPGFKIEDINDILENLNDILSETSRKEYKVISVKILATNYFELIKENEVLKKELLDNEFYKTTIEDYKNELIEQYYNIDELKKQIKIRDLFIVEILKGE